MEQENCCFHFILHLETKLHPDTLTPNIHHTSYMTIEYSTGINLLFLCRTFSHATIMQPGEVPPMFPEQDRSCCAELQVGVLEQNLAVRHMPSPAAYCQRPFLAMGAAVAGSALFPSHHITGLMYTQILHVLLQLPLSQGITWLA